MGDNKALKIILHASAFYLPLLLPILFYLFIDDKEVKRLSLQALMFQFVMYVLITISAFLSIFLIGIPFLIIFIAMTIIVPIIGIVKALNGTYWGYPFVSRLGA